MYAIKTDIRESRIEGEGIFAGEYIPRGTIVYCLDSSTFFITPNELLLLSEEEKNKVIKYGAQNETGNWMMGEDSKKLNHSCDANVLSIFVDDIFCEIAVKDIHEGEEITTDYSLFFSSFSYDMGCNCNASICRKRVTSGQQIDSQTQNLWCLRISEAIGNVFDVKQNLFSSEDEAARKLTSAIKSKVKPNIFPYIKFCLVSQKDP